MPGGGFAEIFGCREDDIASPGGAPVSLIWNGAKGSVEKSHFQACWTPGEDAETIATYDDGRPAVLSHPWGRGRTVISGLNLGISHAPREGLGDDVRNGGTASSGAFAKRIVLSLAREAGVEPPLEAPASVVASLLKGDDGQAILIAINTASERMTGVIRIAANPYAHARDLIENREAVIGDDGVKLSLKGHQTGVFHLTTHPA